MNERIPRELLFGNPEKASPKISPNGKLWAYLAPDEGVLNIWAGPEGGAAKPVTQDRGRGVRNYLWAEDQVSLLYVQDKDGDENWHLYQTNVETGVTRNLTPLPGVQAQIVGTEPKFPNEILVALNDRDPRAHDVYRINLKDGSRTVEAVNPGDVVGWMPDGHFKIRCAKAMRPDGGTILRVLENGAWRDFIACGPDDQLGAHGFSPDGKSLFVESSVDRDTAALLEMPLDGGPAKVLAEDPESDLGPVLIHPREYRVEAVGFEVDRLRWQVLDESLAADFKAFESLDGDATIVSRDDADKVWYLLVNRPDRSPAFWRWDRTARKSKFLFATRPKLDGYDLAPMTPVVFTARDGLKVRAYLTTPAGREARNLPLVVLVHGGPWVRDRWGFHPEAQWLASLGMACLQVNYRGSAGFGKSFLHAGDREWGRNMQNDLTDAAKWAVASGAADPKRVAIYGGSYGGYAALAGAAFTPEVYRCAVDVVGPSNLISLIKSIPPYWEPMKRVFDLRVGDVDKEQDFLKSRSPLFHADKISIPLLIAQGANDPRVKQAESEQIVDALKAKGKPVEYLLFPDEGHGFAKPENRLKFYAAAEKFLAKHLAAAALLLLILVSGAGKAAASAWISESTGTVEVAMPGEDKWTAVKKPPFLLKDGQHVRTSSASIATVFFPDQSKIRLKPDSELIVDEVSKDEASLKLQLGALQAWVTKALSRHFRVRTPSAVASVRGTEFGLDVTALKDTQVVVDDGVVAVKLQNGEETELGTDRPYRSILVIPGRPLRLLPHPHEDQAKDKDKDKKDDKEPKDDKKHADCLHKADGTFRASAEDIEACQAKAHKKGLSPEDAAELRAHDRAELKEFLQAKGLLPEGKPDEADAEVQAAADEAGAAAAANGGKFSGKKAGKIPGLSDADLKGLDPATRRQIQELEGVTKSGLPGSQGLTPEVMKQLQQALSNQAGAGGNAQLQELLKQLQNSGATAKKDAEPAPAENADQ